MDEYTEWCNAVNLDPEEDSTRDAFNDARVAEHEQMLMDIDLEAERRAMESAQFFGDDYWVDPID